jgi:antitoxin MazE
MELAVIKIGNSKGLRLSKTILERYKINDKVEIILEDEHIILKPVAEARKGWDKAFKQMNKVGDDQNLIPDVFEDETFDEWQ